MLKPTHQYRPRFIWYHCIFHAILHKLPDTLKDLLGFCLRVGCPYIWWVDMDQIKMQELISLNIVCLKFPLPSDRNFHLKWMGDGLVFEITRRHWGLWNGGVWATKCCLNRQLKWYVPELLAYIYIINLCFKDAIICNIYIYICLYISDLVCISKATFAQSFPKIPQG